jgi:hypothetical protein
MVYLLLIVASPERPRYLLRLLADENVPQESRLRSVRLQLERR